MAGKKRKPKYARKRNRLMPFLVGAICIAFAAAAIILFLRRDKNETDGPSFGIDVARYQGNIQWSEVASSGIDFVYIRIGYRSMEDGVINEDTSARYNLQEATRHQIPIGVYFFSTAVSREEAIEEAQWVLDYIAPYPITYPVVFDCEGYRDPDSRQYFLSKTKRTEIALAFMDHIQDYGYEVMFYSSKNDMTDNSQWIMEKIERKYKVWVAQYPEHADPETDVSSYEGNHHMWQYSDQGVIPGIDTPVDLNVAYFGYKSINSPREERQLEEAYPDPEALMVFTPVNEEVTAKIETNLRNLPGQGEDSIPMYLLKNGEIALRIGISDSGWSKLQFQGQIYYAVSSLLTTDLEYYPVQTVFREVYEEVTPKIEVNLRNIPSTEHEDSEVIVLLKHGEVVIRTGINEDVGWSRVEYQGRVLYCISSYLETVK